MALPIVDRVLKDIAEYHPESLLRLIFPKATFKILSTRLDQELAVKTRLPDRVILLNTAGGKRLVHLEFQLRYNRKIAERLFVYAGALTAKYQMPVASVLFLIKPSKRIGANGVYRSELFDETINEFRFPVIHLWKLKDAILSGHEDYRIFTPLLLEIESRPDTALLRKVRDLINRESEQRTRAELVDLTLPIASRHFDLGVIRDVFKEVKMTNFPWEIMPQFGEALRTKSKEAKKQGWVEGHEQGHEQGIAEGIAKGIAKGGILGMQEMLIEMLNTQFGKLPERTIRAIHSIRNTRQLKTIARKSLQAGSLAEVQKLLLGYRAKNNGKGHSISARA